MDDTIDSKVGDLRAFLTESIKVTCDKRKRAEESMSVIFKIQIDRYFDELVDNVSRLYNEDIRKKSRGIAIAVINELTSGISE